MREQFSLVGIDGNILSVIGYTREAMRKTKFNDGEITDFCKSVTKQKSYEDALGMCVLKIEECNNRLAQPKSESVKMEYEAFDTDEEIDNFYQKRAESPRGFSPWVRRATLPHNKLFLKQNPNYSIYI